MYLKAQYILPYKYREYYFKVCCYCCSRQVVFDSLRPHGLQHTRLPCPSPSPRVCPKYAAAAKSLQSCPTLCNPIDGSPPGSPVPGILQARVLEWSAVAFSGPKYRSILKSKFFLENKEGESPWPPVIYLYLTI